MGDGEHVTAKLTCYYVPVHVDVSAETLERWRRPYEIRPPGREI
jgi:hypothetical protein